MRSKGIKNKDVVIFEAIKKDVIRDGLRHNAERLEHLKQTDPYTYKRTITKLLKL